MSFLKRVENAIESLWKKEEPTIEADIKKGLEAIKPIWETAFGKLVMSTVQGLQSYAASNGGAAAAKLAFATIATGAKQAGMTAATSTINFAIESAVQELNAVAAAAAPAAEPAPITAAATS